MKRQKTPGASGFTLIEMLMVLVIMTILFGMTLPALSLFRSSGGVEASARQLQAVLLYARSLAAKHNTPYAVVFNNVSEVDRAGNYGVTSTSCENHYYVVVGYHPGESDEDALSTGEKVRFRMMGKKFTLAEGTMFMALTARSSVGIRGWSDFSNGNPQWTGTADASISTALAYGTYKNTALNYVKFLPDGSASFRAPSVDTTETKRDWEDDYSDTSATYDTSAGATRVITISKDGLAGSTSYYDNRLRVIVNKYSGDVTIKPGRR